MRVAGRDRLDPVARFSLALGVILTVTAIALAAVTSLLIGRYVEDETARFTESAVGSHFGTVFRTDVFGQALSAKGREEFEVQVLFHFSVYGVLATHFYDPDGWVVFSYDKSDLGRPIDSGRRPDLEAALAGRSGAFRREIVADMRRATPSGAMASHFGGEHSAAKPDIRRVGTIETWVPVRQNGAVIGAAVVWRYTDEIDMAMRQIQSASAAVIAIAALILWLVLLGVYRRSSERIMAQSTALSEALIETERTYDTTLHALSSALDVRDTETEGHSRRVVRYMDLIADGLGLPEEIRAPLRRGALLHDIGKIGVPDQILRKPAPLTSTEWATMRRHPDLGAGIIGEIPFLNDVARIVRAHHERWDGEGYPDGLAGADIPLGARIFAVADSFDAMTSDRPYRRARPFQEALGEILGGRGTQFDPVVVDEFLRIRRLDLDAVHGHTPQAASTLSA